MVVLNNGLTRIRDLHYADISEADFGDDGSAVTITQTGVQSAITGGSDIAVTKTQGAFSNQFTAVLDSTTATGNTVREVSLGNGTTNQDRSVFPGVAHTSNDELIIIKTYTYDRG